MLSQKGSGQVMRMVDFPPRTSKLNMHMQTPIFLVLILPYNFSFVLSYYSQSLADLYMSQTVKQGVFMTFSCFIFFGINSFFLQAKHIDGLAQNFCNYLILCNM